jgi:sugar lactone lactonase YvrE
MPSSERHPGLRVITDGLGIPESARWHDGRIWCANWGAGEVVAFDEQGNREVRAQLAAEALPISFDWLPDGRMLLVDGPRRLLLRQEWDGSMSTAADLTEFGEAPFNELVVDARGNAYVNGGPGVVVLVTDEGQIRQVAEGLKWPNGMALLHDDRILVVADSHAEALVGYEVAADGSLSEGRTWASLPHAPDGICADAEGAIWASSVPGRRCLRVREGGQILGEVVVDRGCFACMLGGENGRTLYVAAARWKGFDALKTDGPGTSGQLVAAPRQPAAGAGRP